MVESLADRVPVALRSIELDRGSSRVLVGCALVGVLFAGWLAWRSAVHVGPVAQVAVQAVGTPLAASASAGAGGSASAASAVSGLASVAASVSAPPAFLVVDVGGKVRRPGLVRLPPGSRIADALAAAGGALPGVDLDNLNLAQVVADGEQVLVGAAPAAGGVIAPSSPSAGGVAADGSASGPAGASGEPAGGVVDLNQATLEQLEDLPGVGPVLAQRMLDFRAAHGRFSSVDELREVGGIGDKKFEQISPKVKV